MPGSGSASDRALPRTQTCTSCFPTSRELSARIGTPNEGFGGYRDSPLKGSAYFFLVFVGEFHEAFAVCWVAGEMKRI